MIDRFLGISISLIYIHGNRDWKVIGEQKKGFIYSILYI